MIKDVEKKSTQAKANIMQEKNMLRREFVCFDDNCTRNHHRRGNATIKIR